MNTHHITLPLTRSVSALIRVTLACTAVATIFPTPLAFAKDQMPKQQAIGATPNAAPAPEAKPENPPRSSEESIRLGIDYVIKHQQPDGGWGQGGGWRQNRTDKGGRVEGADTEDPSDLGNTCVTLVTLLRAGHSPKSGNYRENSAKAFEFICRFIDKADDESLFVTPVRDTQLQVKIGTYVDTFLAGWVLSELKGNLADDAAEARRSAALDKVVKKIERNQKDDGSFHGNAGWAAVLSQGLCSKALNTAARSGAKVTQEALEKDQRQNLTGLDVKKGDFTSPASPTAEPSSAGVSLYRETSKLNGLSENWKSNQGRRQKAEVIIADKKAPEAAKDAARKDLEKIAEDEKAAQVAAQAVAGKLSNDRFVAGFGNNGGEEFLSYMNVTESLRDQGGKPWDEWKPKMQKTVASAQNADGSWAGHHCITGRTFCTSTALLTLLAGDDAAAKVSKKTDEAAPSPDKPVETASADKAAQ